MPRQGASFPAAVWAAPSKVHEAWVVWLVLAANEGAGVNAVYCGTGGNAGQRAWLMTPSQWSAIRTSEDLAILVEGRALVQEDIQS